VERTRSRKGVTGRETSYAITSCGDCLLLQTGATNIAATLRHYSWKPLEALSLLGLVPP
jgi:hypothetical protein